MKKLITIIIAITMIILTCENVKASEITNWTTAQTRLTTDFNGSYTTTTWGTGTQTFSPTNPVVRIEYRFAYSGGLSNQNTYTFNIGYVPNPDGITPVGITLNAGNVTTLDYTCSSFTRDSVPTYKVSCTFTPNSNLSNSQYIYAVIDFYEGYLSSIRGSYTGFEERKGTNAVITEQTNNIINAGQENTQTIINGINDALQNQCKNILNIQPQFNSKDGITITNNEGIITITGTTNASGDYYYSPVGTLQPGLYYFNVDGNATGINFYLWNNDYLVAHAYNGGAFQLNNTSNISLTLQTISGNTINNTYKLSIFKEENRAFCKYGSMTSKIDETNNILNEDHTYNNNASQNINGQQDLENLDTQDNQIRNSMDFTGIENNNITIDTNTNSFIWGIIERLRGMSQYIVLLMTSIMGIGLIKLVLGR